jgi:hypothetical protein
MVTEAIHIVTKASEYRSPVPPPVEIERSISALESGTGMEGRVGGQRKKPISSVGFSLSRAGGTSLEHHQDNGPDLALDWNQIRSY